MAFKLTPAQTARVQAIVNKIPHWVVVAVTAFGAAAWQALNSADWRPELEALVHGQIGLALQAAVPTLSTAVAAGFAAWVAILRTAPPDVEKVKFADHVERAMSLQRVSEEVTPQGRPVSVSPPSMAVTREVLVSSIPPKDFVDLPKESIVLPATTPVILDKDKP